MAKEAGDIKNFNMRIRKELWMFLKIEASTKETSMTDIIVACIEKHKKSIEKKLTPRDEATNGREKKINGTKYHASQENPYGNEYSATDENYSASTDTDV
jgi:hypothetical protein